MMKAASSTEEASINKEKASLQETYTIDSSGVTIDTMLSGAEGLCYRVPLLVTNGLDTTQIETGEHTARVVLSGHCYTVSTNGRLTVPPTAMASTARRISLRRTTPYIPSSRCSKKSGNPFCRMCWACPVGRSGERFPADHGSSVRRLSLTTVRQIK